MIRHLEQGWRFGSGGIVSDLSSYQLYVLHYLLRLSHFSGYGIAAALFRLKNGPHSFNPGHGTWQIGSDDDHIPFKLFLKEKIIILVEHWCKRIERENNLEKIDNLKEQINLAVKLGELFGLGYQVDTQISKNYYFDEPVDFRPAFAQGEKFVDINFVAHCNTESPLWRVYYLYSRKMWKKPQENKAIFAGQGEAWYYNRNHPRAVLYNIINEYQLKYFLDLAQHTAKSAKAEAAKKKAKETIKKLVKDLTPERREALLSSLG
jgi:hypothetical protein